MALNPNFRKTVSSKDIVLPPDASSENPQQTVGDLGVQIGSPVSSTSHPLEDLGSLVQGYVETGKEKLLNLNLDEYAPYFGNNIGAFGSKEDLDKSRAFRQGSGEQFLNAAGRVAINVVPEMVSQLANAADFEDYFNSDQEVGNWVSNAINKFEVGVDKALPIYRENPDKPLDIGDNAWWFENGSSLVKSAAAFVGAGYLTGAAAGSLFTKGGEALKWLSTMGKESQLADTGKQIANAGATLANAMMLNQAEGVGIATDQFQKSYTRASNDLKASEEGKSLSDEEIDNQARKIAAQEATSALNFNKINILLNLTSANMFMKTSLGTRSLLNAPSLKHGLIELGREGAQEYGEEVINDISQNQATDKDYSFQKAMEYSMTAQGIESGLLGFIGGVGQTALTKAGKYLPIYSNRAYNQAYASHYQSMKNTDLTDIEKDAKAKELALRDVGTNKSRVSDKFNESSRYTQQQNALNRWQNLENSDKIGDISNAFSTTDEILALHKQIADAHASGDVAKAKSLEERTFGLQAKQAFQTGTTDAFEKTYKSFAALTHEEAEKKDIYTEGDENTPNYYKTRANEAVKDIQSLETIYNNSQAYLNSNDVYDMEEHKHYTNKAIKLNLENVTKEFNNALELYKNRPETLPSKTNSFVDLNSPSGYDLNKTQPNFKKTPSYRKIKAMLEADKIYRDNIGNIQEVIDLTTSSSYQEKLKNAINNSRKAVVKENKLKQVFKKRSEKKKEINTLVNTLAKQAKTEVNTNSVVEDVNTINDVIEPGKTLPVENIEEESVVTPKQDEVKKSFPSKPVFVNVPSFNDATINNKFIELKGIAENPDIYLEDSIDYLEKSIDAVRVAKDSNAIPSLEANNVEIGLNSLTEALNDLKAQKAQEVVKADVLKSIGRQLLNSINGEEDIDTNNTDSPSKQFDKAKQQREINLLMDYLNVLDNTGVDITDFKQVVNSFENSTSKAEVIKAFTKLKGLFMAYTGQEVEGSYAEIMYDSVEKQKLSDRYKGINKYNVIGDFYTAPKDDISTDALNSIADLAKLNGLDVNGSGVSTQIYNDTAANLLAYLSKKYKTTFTSKKSDSGHRYIEVTKSDLNNLLNEALNQRVLDPDFLSVGKEITFVPLDSVTLENGDLLYAKDVDVNEKPIGIAVDGELIDGLYLHDTGWININNIDNTSANIVNDQNTLRNLRAHILNSKIPVTTVVQERSAGVPILDESGELSTVLENTPDVEIGIIKEGSVFTGRESIVQTVNISRIDEGKGVIIIPFNNEKLALSVKRAKLDTGVIDSIITATELYLNGTKTELTDELDKTYQINILTSRGLEQYINQFIGYSSLDIKDKQSFSDKLINIADNISLIQFNNGRLYYGQGQEIGVNDIYPSKNNGEERQKDLKHFRQHLKKMYHHINLDLLGTDTGIKLMQNNKVLIPYNTYNEYAKSVMLSPYLSMKLDNGKTIYTLQSRIKFDLEKAFSSNNKAKNVIKSLSEPLDNTNVENTVQPLSEPKSNDISLPNGKTFSFNDVTEDTLSPAKENNNLPNVLLPIGTSGSGKSTFIKSLPQENLVIIEPDAMRVEFTGDINNKTKDKEIYEEATKRAIIAIKQGKQVVFDTTNLTKDKRLPFIEAIKKEIPNANIQYKLMELNPELAKQRIKAQIEKGENRANVSDETINRHAQAYQQMLEDIKEEPLTEFNDSPNLIGNENYDDLINSSSLIPGLSVTTQTSLVRSIVNDIYNEASDSAEPVKLNKQLKLAVESLEMIRDKAVEINHSKAGEINKVVEAVKANVKKLTKAVNLEYKKRNSVVGVINLDNYNELSIDEEQSIKDGGNDKLQLTEYTIDPKTTLTGRAKQMLEGITDKKVTITEDGKEFTTKTTLLNLNIFIPFDIVYNNLISILGKSNTNANMVQVDSKLIEKHGKHPDYVVHALEELSKHIETKPYLIDVMEKLKTAEPDVQNSFISALNKVSTNHIYVHALYDKPNNKYSLRINKAASKNITNLVLSEWQNNLNYSKLLSLDNDRIIYNFRAIDAFNKQFKEIADKNVNPNYKELSDLLKLVGIEIPIQLYNTWNKYGIKVKGTNQTLLDSFKFSTGIFKNIGKRLNSYNTNNAEWLNLSENNLYDDSSFTSLANLVSYYRVDLFNDSFKNANGDTIFGYTNDRYAITRALKLKTDVKLLSDLKSDVFAQDSVWLNQLLKKGDTIAINEESTFYKYFQYGTAESLKTKNALLGKTIDTLKPAELAKFHFSLFQNGGLKIGKDSDPTPIMQVIYPTMEEKANAFIFQVPGEYYKLTAEGKMHPSDKQKLVEILIYPEIQRILKHQADPNAVQIDGYKEGAGKFLLFPKLNDDARLFDKTGQLLDEVLLPEFNGIDFQNILQEHLYNHLMQIFKDTRENWKKFGIITTDKNSKQDQFQYIDASYKAAFAVQGINTTLLNYVINTTVANMNIQQLFIGDPALYYKGSSDAMTTGQLTADNQGKRLSADNAGAIQLLFPQGSTFNTLVIKDNYVSSKRADYIEKLYKGFPDIYGQYKKGTLMSNGKQSKGINSTDAQGYHTLEEHLDIMHSLGTLSLKDKTKILDTYNKTGKINKSDKALVLQPFKPRYVNNFNRFGVNARLYFKYSTLPLIKQFTQGTDLDVLREHMEKNKIQLVLHESAVKVGGSANIIDVYDSKGNIVIPVKWKSSLITNIPREGLGIQQDVPYNSKQKTVNDGTQQAKELFTNIMDIDGFIDPETGKAVTGRELSKTYLVKYKKSFLSKYNKLIQELDFDTKTHTIGNYDKLYKLLEDEGYNRNYSSNDIQGLETVKIGNKSVKFTVPLWLNTADSKIVALLNSIVDNKVRKRSFRGKSFVLASESGTQLKTIKDVNLSEVVKVGDWDGTLKGAWEDNENKGQMSYAEVLVPFKFWDNKGELLKLDEFMNDGVIDLTRLPEELLEIFGYRIPTSGLNLISNIKIVGFLPASYGDIVIAPADFIVQMGSDFDVDKLYTHMYNTHYNDVTKSLHIVNKDISSQHNNITQSIKVMEDRVKELSRNGVASAKDNNLIVALQQQINLLKESDLMQLKDIDEQVIQNDLLDIHKAVLNNPNVEVQKARTNPLSFGELPALAKEIYKESNRFFTPLANTYQQNKYLSARASKTAVGVFSLDTVFNSVLQYIEKPMYFTKVVKEGENMVTKDIRYTIGGYTTNALNNPKRLDGKWKSDSFIAFMATALDNGKEQLLGKLNINSDTFDFIRAANQLGLPENLVILMINQPAIKAYQLSKQFFEDVEIKPFNEDIENILSTTSIENLLKTVKGDDITSDRQQAYLSFFKELSSKGRQLKILQSAINSDSSGIGKNIFYSIKKAEQILNLPKSTEISNVDNLIGNYIYLNESPAYNKLSVEEQEGYINTKKEDGYILYNNVLIQPTSLGGMAGVYATMLNNQLWSKLYPYTDKNYYSIITSIIPADSDNSTIQGSADALQNSVTNYKSFLISNTFNLFTSKYTSITEARKDLLFDRENHLSLGSFISQIKNTKAYSNAMLDRLQIGRSNQIVDITGSIPTVITYQNAGSVEMDEEVIINSFIDMIVNPQDLGQFNGESINTKQLADLLITHQMINGGIQKSNQFIKYIPFKYLQKRGFYKAVESTNVVTNVDTVNQIRNTYYTQYLQHNPEEFYNEFYDIESPKFVNDYKNIVNGKLVGVDPQLSEKTNFVITNKANSEIYRIFKHDDMSGDFIEIDNLGWKGNNEYDINATFAARSSIYINQVDNYSNFDKLNGIDTSNFEEINDDVIENAEEHLPNPTETSNFLRLDRDTKSDNSPAIYNENKYDLVKKYYLDDNNLSIEDKYRLILKEVEANSTNPIVQYFSKKLVDIIPYLAETPLYVNTKLPVQGRATTTKLLGEPVRIEINPNLISSDEEMAEVLMEEMIHGLLKTEISKGSSEFVKSLNSIKNEVRSILIEKYGKEAFDTVDKKIVGKLPLKEGVERNLIYNVYNLDEFVAAAIKDKTFQAFLNSTESLDSTKSIFSRFVDYIKNLLVKLGVVPDKNLSAVLHEIINVVESPNFQVGRELVTPKYVRTVGYLNNKFNLTNNTNELRSKGNAEEIADFINRNIVNVEAVVKDNFVILTSKKLYEVNEDNSFGTEDIQDEGFGSNLVNYYQSLTLRVAKLKANIKKAVELKDFVRVADLTERYNVEKDKLVGVKKITAAVDLADKGEEDLQMIETILNRKMTSEDIVYARGVLNFWKDAKRLVFNERLNSSKPLTRIYGAIEGSAEALSDKLFKIEKTYMEEYIKKYTDQDINLDQQFKDYKDINIIQANVRDISSYDNILLSSIWSSVKHANIAATNEGNEKLESINNQLTKVVPVLKSLGNAELFEVFRQKNSNGKLTGHIINPYTDIFYKDRAKVLKKLNKDNTQTNFIKYLNWINQSAFDVDLESIFPTTGETDATTIVREELKQKLGAGVYSFWFKNQKNKIDSYNDHKFGQTQSLLAKYKLASEQDILNSDEANREYKFWIEKNSPYRLAKYAFQDNIKLSSEFGYTSQKYYEVIPKDSEYLDSNYDTISNNPELLEFYNTITDLFKDLKKYVPESQQKTLAYGGVPSLEKSIVELYTEHGMQLGVLPIQDIWTKSMQSSFGDNTSTIIDPVTNRPINEMRIPIIKDNYKEVQKYIKQKSAEYLIENNKAPSADIIKGFEEDIINEISEGKSFDLGKIAKVYTALVLAHKHKSKIEDSVKIANTVLNKYEETRLRPDGTPETDAMTGAIQRKGADQSFGNIKSAYESYINNVFYGDIHEEEGKGKKSLTKSEKLEKAKLLGLLNQLEVQHDNKLIEDELYKSTKDNLTEQLGNLGKTFIYSKAGDNVLKYVQLKLMGWNVLGGISNMGFGWLSNQIEAAGGQFFNKADLAYAYKLSLHSITKNASFNKLETDTARKIREGMDKWDILKDASHELYTSSTPSSFDSKLKFLKPFNVNQRTEYLNQAPLFIALSRNTMVDTTKGKISLWDGFDKDWNWNEAEYGAEPTEVINKMRIKLDVLIKRTHGNYDNLSPLKVKRTFTGRAASQFRTWLYESIATRIEDERFDANLGETVKGRYRSVGSLANITDKNNAGNIAFTLLKGFLQQFSFGTLPINGNFEELIDGEKFKEIDAVNMRKVCMEIALALDLYLFLLLVSAFAGDDDEAYTNILLNQGARLKTDLLLYVNPIEARNIVKDIIPAMSIVKDTGDWMNSVGRFAIGEDEIESGVHDGDSRVLSNTIKMLPFGSKAYSIYNSGSQQYSK
jgi:predicted kinase